jgi:hypothetical protein
MTKNQPQHVRETLNQVDKAKAHPILNFIEQRHRLLKVILTQIPFFWVEKGLGKFT